MSSRLPSWSCLAGEATRRVHDGWLWELALVGGDQLTVCFGEFLGADDGLGSAP